MKKQGIPKDNSNCNRNFEIGQETPVRKLEYIRVSGESSIDRLNCDGFLAKYCPNPLNVRYASCSCKTDFYQEREGGSKSGIVRLGRSNEQLRTHRSGHCCLAAEPVR
jgi:hypothetical protein